MYKILSTLIFLISLNVSAQISVQNSAECLETSAAGSNPQTCQYDTGIIADDRKLICHIMFEPGLQQVSDVTYAGIPMDNIISMNNTYGESNPNTQVFKLDAPPTGSNQLSFNLQTTNGNAAAWCMTLNDAGDIGAVSSIGQKNNTGTDPVIESSINTTTANSTIYCSSTDTKSNTYANLWTMEGDGNVILANEDNINGAGNVTGFSYIVNQIDTSIIDSYLCRNRGPEGNKGTKGLVMYEIAEAPTNTINDAYINSIDEHMPNATLIYDYNDANLDNDVGTYTEIFDECNCLSMNPNTGVVTIDNSAMFDYERFTEITYIASVSGNDQGVITIPVGNVDDFVEPTRFVNENFEDETELLGAPYPNSQDPTKLWKWSDGFMFSKNSINTDADMWVRSNTVVNDGNYSLRLQFDGRNNRFNECLPTKENGIEKYQDTLIHVGGDDSNQLETDTNLLTLFSNNNPVDFVYNKDDQFCKWEVESFEGSNFNIANFINDVPIQNDMGGECDFDSNDEVLVFHTCDANEKRSDCNACINYFTGHDFPNQFEPGDTLSRRFYLYLPSPSSNQVYPNITTKLGYWKVDGYDEGSLKIQMSNLEVTTVMKETNGVPERKTGIILEYDTWYYIEEVRVRESTLGGTDGAQRIHIDKLGEEDDIPEYVRENMTFGDSSTFSFMGNFQNTNDAKGYIYFDDLVIADGYIGPIQTVSNISPIIVDSTISIDEEQANGTVVFDFNDHITGIDIDSETINSPNSINYSITSQSPEGAFQINSTNGEISILDSSLLDADNNQGTLQELSVHVMADDGQGQTNSTDTATLTINLTPVNDNSPTIDCGIELSVIENQSDVTTCQASDADIPEDTLSFSVSGGVDQSLFAINSSAGNSAQLSFNTLPDFENPLDQNADNIYEVIVQVSDGSNVGQQILNISVLPDNPSLPDLISSGSVIDTTATTNATTQANFNVGTPNQGGYLLCSIVFPAPNSIVGQVTYGGSAMTELLHIMPKKNNQTGDDVYLYGITLDGVSGSNTLSVPLTSSGDYLGTDCFVYEGISGVGATVTSNKDNTDAGLISDTITTTRENSMIVGYVTSSHGVLGGNTQTWTAADPSEERISDAIWIGSAGVTYGMFDQATSNIADYTLSATLSDQASFLDLSIGLIELLPLVNHISSDSVFNTINNPNQTNTSNLDVGSPGSGGYLLCSIGFPAPNSITGNVTYAGQTMSELLHVQPKQGNSTGDDLYIYGMSLNGISGINSLSISVVNSGSYLSTDCFVYEGVASIGATATKNIDNNANGFISETITTTHNNSMVIGFATSSHGGQLTWEPSTPSAELIDKTISMGAIGVSYSAFEQVLGNAGNHTLSTTLDNNQIYIDLSIGLIELVLLESH